MRGVILEGIFETTLCPHQDYAGRHLGPHSPCKMTDFEVHLAPTWWGRISGPEMGYFQVVSGLFLITSGFIIFEEIFETTLCPDQDYSGPPFGPSFTM